MNETVNNMDELRRAITRLNAYTVGMCNVKTSEEVSKMFVECKELLIAVYKYNIDRTSGKN